MLKYYFKRFFYLFLPPIFTKYLLKKTPSLKKKNIIKLSENENINFIKYNKESIFEIHNTQLRYFGGLGFNKISHPFLKFLLGNKEDMTDFYNTHEPKNIFECHKLDIDKTYSEQKFLNDPEGSLPWLHYNDQCSDNIEGNLKAIDGRQQFGPISDKKLNFEIDRLNKVVVSIRDKGFTPEKYEGYPRGYFMQNNDGKWVFYIVGGSHRVAALISLNYEYVPVILQPKYPNIVLENDINNWPKIKDNKITNSNALKIFLSYF
tara:strand:+ start:2929 stop:3714 length:786 start_codon:yes stop_codon:yes gene_type:complete